MSRPVSRFLRRCLAAGLVAAMTMLGAQAAWAGTRRPTPTTTVAAAATVPQVSLTLAAPEGVAAQHGKTTLTALVTNGTAGIIPDGKVSFWSGGRLTDRSAITSWDAATTAAPTKPLGSAQLPLLEPGQSAGVSVHVARSAFGSAGSGPRVYGIGATMTATALPAVRSHSTVLLQPASVASAGQAELTVAVPITAPASQSGVLSAADLARFTAPDGILTRDVDGLAGHPEVAVGLDPRIIASIRVLGSQAPASAIAWQESLLALPNEIFALQYGDADAAAQVQAGVDRLLKPTSFDWATGPAHVHSTTGSVGETPQNTPTETPGATPTPSASSLPDPAQILAWPYTTSGIVWPPDDVLSTSDLTAFQKNGLSTVIASSDNVKEAAGASSPSRLRVDGEDVLVSDAALSDALDEAVTAATPTQWNAAMAALNAHLALLGGTKANVLATLARTWPTSTAELARTLDALDQAPDGTLASLSTLLAAPAATGASLIAKKEPAARLDDVRRLIDRAASIDSFASALVEPQLLRGRERARLLSLLGVGWLGPNDHWHDGVEQSLSRSSGILSAISIVPGSPVNVASTEAPLPVTVENRLDDPVDLVLSAIPSNPRLEIDGAAHKTVPADARGTVLVPVKARLGNGKVELRLQLSTSTGVPIGASVTVPVDVHAQWEGVAATVLAALIVALFGFGVVRNIRRHLRSRRDPAAAQAGSDG